ncbi:MAG: polyphosphate polymerase domain-containing protein [Alphaproteobacteria bacterium]|nr:polyphosphate polymerase domain-containing protein [Alphaproteobacteria bacterium]
MARLDSFDRLEGRVELKYVVHERACVGLREDALLGCETDTRAGPLPGGLRGYTVSSIYLDDEALSGYSERLENAPIRNRIRIRTYGRPGYAAPVFLEHKRKYYDRVIKQRVEVGDADTFPERNPGAPWRAGMLKLSGVKLARAQRFDALVARTGARARCVVRYEREVFVDGDARFTLDHDIRAGRCEDMRALYAPAPLRLLPTGAVVVEMKFDQAMPGWMQALLRRHGLCSEPVSKFGLAMAMLYGREGDVRRLTPHGARRVA